MSYYGNQEPQQGYQPQQDYPPPYPQLQNYPPQQGFQPQQGPSQQESSGPIHVIELRNEKAKFVKIVTDNIEVRWKQGIRLENKLQTYKECIYNTEKGNVTVFVQSDLKIQDRFKLDGSFQYGVTEDNQLFFVLHDRRQKFYQERFQITPINDNKSQKPSVMVHASAKLGGKGKYLRDF